ncbi:MAG: helix-turn-helix domain-containing protein [Rubrivivax sp.]
MQALRMSPAAAPVDPDPAAAEARRPMVMPFARALMLLAVFTPQRRWLSNRDFVEHTGLPASTITRIGQSLVQLGYLQYDAHQRLYRLAAPVLALGYAAFANSDVQQAARVHMKDFVRRHKLHVSLSCRDRLDLIVLESCDSGQAAWSLNLDVGARVGIAASPMGWALLAALPELERYYLLDKVERKIPRQWPTLRRRCNEAIAQVQELGYCAAATEPTPELGVVAAPLWLENHAPLVLSCVGANLQMSRARIQREIGPQLVALADAIQQRGAVE